MRNYLEYKGYQGSVEYSAEDGILHGRVLANRSVFSYEGADVESLKRDFEAAVDDYLELCQERGTEPEKPYKGSFNVRVASDLHRRAALYADTHDSNLNTVVAEALESYLKAMDA